MTIDKYIKRERKADERRRAKLLNKTRPAKTMALAIGIFAGMIVGVSLVHELGHGLVCMSEGYESRIWLDATGGHMVCFGKVQNEDLSHIAGPLAGMAAVIPIAVISIKRHWAIVIPAAVTLGLDQVLKIGIEGFANDAYSAGHYNVFMSMVQAGVFIGLLALIVMKQKKEGKQ